MSAADRYASSGPPETPEAAGTADRDLPLDAHLHTDRSADADVPLEVHCALAAERGIAEIAITDHIDFSPGWPNYRPDAGERQRLVRRAAERWAPLGVTVRYGLEVSYESRREDEIREHLASHPYDFVIGSVHVGPESPYRPANVARWVAGRTLSEVVAPYFTEVAAAARSGLFDTLGHLDFVKRYLVPHVGPGVLGAALELYEPVLRALVEGGTALEVNSSGLRQAARETYPGQAAVALFLELGGRRVTAGSDAHLAADFARGLATAYRVAAAAGFEALTFRGRRIEIPLPAATIAR